MADALIPLEAVKKFVRVTHNDDDDLLQLLLDGAVSWAQQQLDLPQKALPMIPTETDDGTVAVLAPAVKLAILVHVQAHFDTPDPKDRDASVAFATRQLETFAARGV